MAFHGLLVNPKPLNDLYDRNNKSRKISYLLEFDGTLRFWCPCVALDAWMNFVFCSVEILRSNFHRS